MDAAAWDTRYADAELVWSAEPNAWIESQAAGMRPGRVLDLAAGEGRNAIWLAGLGWQATAVDFSQVGLDKGRRIAESFDDDRAERIVWHAEDLLTYRPEPAGYDLVIIAYLQVPAEVRRVVMAAAAGALDAGGTLLVIAHDSRNLADGTGGPQDPSVLYTAEDLQTDLALAGVTLRVDTAGLWHRSVPGAQRPALDAVLRATALAE